jgi:uncharacterized membrane protein YoaT (DUF817 family)
MTARLLTVLLALLLWLATMIAGMAGVWSLGR